MRVSGSAGSGLARGSCPSAGGTAIEVSVQSGRTRQLFFFKKKGGTERNGCWGPCRDPPRDHPGTLQTTFRYSVYIWHRDRAIHPHSWGLWPTGWLFPTCVCEWERPLAPHYCPGSLHPDTLQYSTGRICTFLVSPLWISIEEITKRYFE